MNLKVILYSFVILFMAFTLEQLPLPVVIDWFQPVWPMLAVMALVFFSPVVFGFWLAVPVGLLMDIETGSLLGLHVLMVGVEILLIQLLYRRLYMYNVLQQAAVIFLLVAVTQLCHYWSSNLIRDDVRQVSIWLPALMSALMWPWIYVVGYRMLLKFQRT